MKRHSSRGACLRGLAATAVVLWGVPFGIQGAPSTAAAQAPNENLRDTVELVNGGFILGVVTEYIPGSYVVVRTAQGDLRRLPADEIAAVRRGQAASPAALVPDPIVLTESSLDRIFNSIAGQRLQLKVTANQAASLERRISLNGRPPDDSDTIAYHLVCEAPCTAVLPARDSELYRVHAPSAQPSDWFSLPSSDATVHADLVHHTWTFLPRALLYTGLVFGGVSGVFYGLHETDVTSRWSSTTSKVFAVGAATSLLASGIIWIFRPKSKLAFMPAGH